MPRYVRQSTYHKSKKIMEAKYSPEKAYEILAKRCSVAEKCSGDTLRKLREWGFSSDISHKIVARLIQEKYISDERYARAYVRDKSQLGKWGKRKIEMMLRSKGVAQRTIEDAISQMIDSQDEEQICYEALQKKIRSVRYKDKYDLRNKLMRFGASRGYGFDHLQRAIRALIGELEDTND